MYGSYNCTYRLSEKYKISAVFNVFNNLYEDKTYKHIIVQNCIELYRISILLSCENPVGVPDPCYHPINVLIYLEQFCDWD